MNVAFPHPGIQVWKNEQQITIFRLHYSADPDKTPEWAADQKAHMTEGSYRQEFEIDFTAKEGELLYQFVEEYTLESSFPIPQNWTRYVALDPHPRVPHAFLWAACDPWGDCWIYRELWPSKCCLQYVGGRLVGDKGNVPEDDNRIRYKDYIETVQWLESKRNNLRCADGQSESAMLDSQGHERIYKRVLDYAARSFQDAASDDRRTIQEKYEEISQEVGYPFYFEDALKDVDTGIETVNEWLKPRTVEGKGGEFIQKSRLHIFSDKCPELIHQLKSNRFEPMTPVMAEKVDPQGKPRAKRNHLTDCLRYIVMAGPQFVGIPRKHRQEWKPLYAGVAY